MGESLIQIIEKFGGSRIVVVGDIMIDCYTYGKINRLNPESAAPLITINDSQEDYRLGGAGNVALNARALGAKVDLYGAIGDDEDAGRICDMCKNYGINLIACREGKTIKKQRFIERSPEKNNFHYLLRADFGEENSKPLSDNGYELLFWEFMKRYSAYDGVILSDYNKKVLRGRLGREIIATTGEKRILTLVDPKPENDYSSFIGADIIRPNIHEARKIAGNNNLPIRELALELKSKMRAKYSVISCGAEGLAIYADEFIHLPSKARNVVDVSGAGDTVASALLLGLISGGDIIKAGRIANYASGIVVEKQGTSYAKQKELIERITSEKND